MFCFRENIWLVFLHPQNFRRGKSRQRDVACDLNKFFLANDLMDLIALTLRALVVPQDGWTQNISCFIEQNQAMHLTRQTDRRDSFPTDACLFQDRSDAR